MFKTSSTYKLTALIFIILFSNSYVLQAGETSIGIQAGGGVINGNSPDQGSFTSSIFFETNPGFGGNTKIRMSFFYNVDFNIMLPKAVNRYYPFMKGISLQAVLPQRISEDFFIEEGAGLLVLNDRTYSFVDTWNYGTTFSLAVGLDIKKSNKKIATLGLGTEFGLTFNNSLAKFFSIGIQAKYML